MSEKVACIWLPTEATWLAFLADCGVPIDSPLSAGDRRTQTHAEAVEAAIDTLAGATEKERWLILAPPHVANKSAPGCDLSRQDGRATAAQRLAERRKMVLGLSVRAGAIGWALLSQPTDAWLLREAGERRGVKIIEAAGKYDEDRPFPFC